MPKFPLITLANAFVTSRVDHYNCLYNKAAKSKAQSFQELRTIMVAPSIKFPKIITLNFFFKMYTVSREEKKYIQLVFWFIEHLTVKYITHSICTNQELQIDNHIPKVVKST